MSFLGQHFFAWLEMSATCRRQGEMSLLRHLSAPCRHVSSRRRHPRQLRRSRCRRPVLRAHAFVSPIVLPVFRSDRRR